MVNGFNILSQIRQICSLFEEMQNVSKFVTTGSSFVKLSFNFKISLEFWDTTHIRDTKKNYFDISWNSLKETRWMKKHEI